MVTKPPDGTTMEYEFPGVTVTFVNVVGVGAPPVPPGNVLPSAVELAPVVASL